MLRLHYVPGGHGSPVSGRRGAVVKTGCAVMGREGTGYAKVIVVDAVQDLTSPHDNSRFDHGAARRPETGLPWPPGT